MRVTLRKSAMRLHRWISLSCLAFWIVQALTGTLIVFHWEIDDALVAGDPASFDPAAIEKRIEHLTPAGSGRSVGSIWESGGLPNRFDLYLDGPNGSSIVRVDGAGTVLRERADGQWLADGAWIDTLVGLHHDLLSGEAGSWIVGLSGIVLLINLILGLTLAWPRAGQWRRALLPGNSTGKGVAKVHAWHRALGLWVAAPALASVGAGTLLVFHDTVDTVLQPAPVEAPSPKPGAQGNVGFAAAVKTALDAFPDARVSGVSLPSAENPFYKVRLLQPEETRRIYGTTTVYVHAADGKVAARFDALTDGPARSISDGLFPFHTGEMGGLPGRVAVMAIGLWLLVMIALGAYLWWRRSRPRQRAQKPASN